MSGGGAGKVYFVLYLAVILELLIIIVERDEAEEHLVKRQKESMKIVESILSQLQTGAGSEGINTRPQDEIVLTEKLPQDQIKNFKKFRTYFIEVGVTDVIGSEKLDGLEPKELKEREAVLKKLANVEELQYEIYYNSSKEVDVPSTPSDSSFRRVDISPTVGAEVRDNNIPEAPPWTLQASRRIELSLADMQDFRNPVYKNSAISAGDINRYAPGEAISANTIFQYSPERTENIRLRNNGKLAKRAFVVNFQPPSQPGWYKLRFFSRTNRILGIAGEQNMSELNEEAKVNIGTVQLKVKDLQLVKKELGRQLEELKLPDADGLATGTIEPEDFMNRINAAKDNIKDDTEMRSKIDLYSYIARLLAPGKSGSFEQNKGSIEIDIRVNQPDVPIGKAIISDLPQTVRVFDKLSKVEIPFKVSPANGRTEIAQNPGGATVQDAGGMASGGDEYRQVPKKVVLPISGNLAPRAEPYIIEVKHRNSANKENEEPAVCSVYVYKSELTNADQITSALEAGWGDNIEFTAEAASGNAIKSQEFLINVTMGGSQKPTMRKLAILPTDNIIIPQGVDKVSCQIGWEDPYTKEVVTLYSGEGEASLKRPSVILTSVKVSPIQDQQTGEFTVEGIQVKAPSIGDDERAEIGNVNVEVTGQARDIGTNENYRAVVVGKPTKVNANEYRVTLKLTGGKFPLKKGQVKGSITVVVSATATSGGVTSKPRQARQNISVNN